MSKAASEASVTPIQPAHSGLVAALIAAQRDFGKAVKDSINPHFKSRYVDLQGVYDACRDALAANGLTTIQTIEAGHSCPVLVTELAHISGENRKSFYPLQPAKQNDPQALGACLTYARRYSLMALVGLAPEDDDGEEASGRGDTGPKAPQRAPANVQSVPPSAPVAVKPTGGKILSPKIAQLQIEARKRAWAGSTAEEHRDSRVNVWRKALNREDIKSATDLLDSEFDAAMAAIKAQPLLPATERAK